MSILIGGVLSLLWLAYNAHHYFDQSGQWRNLDVALVALAVVLALAADGLHVERQKLKRTGRR